MDFKKYNSIKMECIKILKEINIDDTKGWVDLTSDITAMLYCSIKINKLRRDLLIENVETQTDKKYNKLMFK